MKMQFDIIKHKSIFFIISAVIILAGIVGFFLMGFNADMDFVGGTAMNINMGAQFDNRELENLVSDTLGFAPTSVQNVGDGTEASIKLQTLDSEQRTQLFGAIKEKYGLEDSALISIENVSATVGNELRQQAILSAIIVAILLLVYVSIRFDFLSGCAAVLSLIHVILIMLSFCVLFQFKVGSTFIAAILTILGYGINDTIIVFDRIRENNKFAKKETFGEIVNKSIWQTMARTINTSVTTLITILLLFILGVTSIKEFALPIIIGIIAGTYSSIFIASPLWVIFKGNSGPKGGKKTTKAKPKTA